MKQETIKIQVLNDTKLCVLPVLPDMETVVPVESISGLTVSWGIHGHETEPVAVQIENGYIVLPISATMPLGVYSVHMQGTVNGEKWSDNRYEMFELTKYGEGIRYDRYYTTTVIVGLPDETLAQIIAEMEAKRDEYQQRIDQLDRGEVATKEDLNSLAKAGEKAKTLDDIKVDIPKGLAMEETLVDAAGMIANHLHQNNDESIINCIYVNDQWYFRTGRVVENEGKRWYVWQAYGTMAGKDRVYILVPDVKVGTHAFYSPDEYESDYDVVQEAENDTIAKEATAKELDRKISDISTKIGGVVMMTSEEYAPALADLDSKLV